MNIHNGLLPRFPRVLAVAEADHLPLPMFQNADIRFTVLMRESSEATGRHRPTAVRLQGSERLIAGALSVAAKTVVQLESELELRRHQLSEVLVVSLLAPAVTPIFRVAVCDTICEALGEAPWRGFPEKEKHSTIAGSEE